MEVVSPEIVAAAIEILAVPQIDRKEIQLRMSKHCQDSVTVQRLIDWPPEAFAIVFISHHWKVALPTKFTTFNAKGKPRSFDFSCDPVFVESFRLAERALQNGAKDLMDSVSRHSAILSSATKALHDLGSLDGCTMGNPTSLGIPAETYEDNQTSFWRKWFR